MSDINGDTNVRPEVLESFAQHSGFLKPYEGDERLGAIDEVLEVDLAEVGTRQNA